MKRITRILALTTLGMLTAMARAQTGAVQGYCDLGGKTAVVSGMNSSNYLQGIIPHCTVTVYLNSLYSVQSATYTSGGTVTGTSGQTCNATFLGGTVNGTGTILLTGTNTIQSGSAFVIPIPTGNYSSPPTTATLSNGTATCSGTAVISAVMTPSLASIYSDSTGTPLTNPFKATVIGTTKTGSWIFWSAINQGVNVVLSGGDAPLTYPSPVTITDIFPSSSFSAPVSGVVSINGTGGAYTFNGPVVSCTGTTCTFSATPALTSLNGLTGPALILESLDASVGITTVRDLWAQSNLGTMSSYTTTVSGYGLALLKVTPPTAGTTMQVGEVQGAAIQ